MPQGSNRLIIFTRYPQPGTTKTRMIPKLGDEGAAELQRQMTEHIVSRVTGNTALRSTSVEVRFEGGNKHLMAAWLGTGFDYSPQGNGDIGIRMSRAFEDGFGNGYASVVIIGSDIPDITGDIVNKAFDELRRHDLVLGPAADGGYYLIAMGKTVFIQAAARLFGGIRWGTEGVLSQTLAAADRLSLSFFLLDTLADVDRPEDLTVWQQTSKTTLGSLRAKRLSIIIPTLNEAERIKGTITQLQQCKEVEIVVVDGGSRDNTVEVAGLLGARVLQTNASKAVQMNAGAAASVGDVLLFLHADTHLPDNFDTKVMAAVSQHGFCAGAFSLAIGSDVRGLRFIERVANWRSRFFQMPYGDQALFVCRDLFDEIGGFPDLPIMEDFELIRRLRRKGKISILPDCVTTSPRRYLNFGIIKTWCLNQIIIAAYYLGVPPTRLACWYRRE
ncbi:MAG: TIGR04283 family arsenosugar biosynthesis glycosyltransferase, partial [Desulfobacterales bacterium]